MTGLFSVLSACVVLSLTAFAQHPCEVPAPTVYREPVALLSSLRIGFCFAPVDTTGVPITEAIGFTFQVNNGPPIDLGILEPQSGPTAAGEQYYEFQTPALDAGVITIRAYTAATGMSAPSDAITLTLLGSPKKPVNVTIIRGE